MLWILLQCKCLTITELLLSRMLLKAVTCLQFPAADPHLAFIFAGENQWRSQSNLKCLSAQNGAAQQQVSIQFQQLIFPWTEEFKGSLVYKWKLEVRNWKKSAENIPLLSLCAECSLVLLQLFLALGNQNRRKIFSWSWGGVWTSRVSWCLYFLSW